MSSHVTNMHAHVRQTHLHGFPARANNNAACQQAVRQRSHALIHETAACQTMIEYIRINSYKGHRAEQTHEKKQHQGQHRSFQNDFHRCRTKCPTPLCGQHVRSTIWTNMLCCTSHQRKIMKYVLKIIFNPREHPLDTLEKSSTPFPVRIGQMG